MAPKADRAVTDHVAPWRRTIRYHLVRALVWTVLRAYVRPRLEGREDLPQGPYLLCFNHLNWVDPFVIVALWPGRPRLYFFGPREEEMGVGARNRLIGWLGTAVPFKPGKNDLLTSTRRAVAVLDDGNVLGIAAEGQLGEDENSVLPLNEGAAYFALRAGVPLVPVAVNGTRWLRFGKPIRVRVGQPIAAAGRRASHASVDELTAEAHRQLSSLVRDYPDQRIPGPFGRWLTDVFSERPWRDQAR